jgi:hypothetical protein
VRTGSDQYSSGNVDYVERFEFEQKLEVPANVSPVLGIADGSVETMFNLNA